MVRRGLPVGAAGDAGVDQCALAGRAAAWGRFRKDPEWEKLKAIPEYADKEIVSHIDNWVLTPAAYSEL